MGSRSGSRPARSQTSQQHLPGLRSWIVRKSPRPAPRALGRLGEQCQFSRPGSSLDGAADATALSTPAPASRFPAPAGRGHARIAPRQSRGTDLPVSTLVQAGSHDKGPPQPPGPSGKVRGATRGASSLALAAVVGVDEAPGRRLQCLRLLHGPASSWRSAAASRRGHGSAGRGSRGRPPAGAGSRFGREGVGLAGQDLYGTQVARLGGRGRRADPVRR